MPPRARLSLGAVIPAQERAPRGVLPFTLGIVLMFTLLPLLGRARIERSPSKGPTSRAQGAVAPRGDLVGHQHWAIILCKFADVSAEPEGTAFFEAMFKRDSGPSMDDYWDEVSYGNVRISADAYGWYNLPSDQADYNYPGNFFAWLVIQDCVDVADADVDFNNYDGVAVMLNSDSPIVMWTKLFTPPDGAYLPFHGMAIPSNKWCIAVAAHEMGHGYLMPHGSRHSYAGGEVYKNPWDVMGIPSRYNCAVNRDGEYGCLGQHTLAYFKYVLGWLEPEQVFEASDGLQTISLERLAQPQTDNYRMAWIPIDARSGYSIEARRRVGYDAKLAGDAVIIHKVWRDAYGGAIVDLVDVDGAPYDDEGAMWTAGETFSDPVHDISVRVDAATATGFVLTIDAGFTSATGPTGPAAVTGERGEPSLSPNVATNLKLRYLPLMKRK
jgi:M6 family metalloprotease-like protein